VKSIFSWIWAIKPPSLTGRGRGTKKELADGKEKAPANRGFSFDRLGGRSPKWNMTNSGPTPLIALFMTGVGRLSNIFRKEKQDRNRLVFSFCLPYF
jgi:hypothetical protein